MSRTATRSLALALGLAMLLCLGLGPASTASAKPRVAHSASVPVAGTLADGAGAVAGTLDIVKFKKKHGHLLATGTFTGTVTDAAGAVRSGTQRVTVPVDTGAGKAAAGGGKAAAAAGTCQILDLVLGPLDLDLLGLKVHLDRVHLNITAQSGPGNLLGNLLCAVAGLLDQNTGLSSLLAQLTALLNQILGVLG